jgi:hypothetical protein
MPNVNEDALLIVPSMKWCSYSHRVFASYEEAVTDNHRQTWLIFWTSQLYLRGGCDQGVQES